MSDEILARHCAPTLLGQKPGSLFAVDCPSKVELGRRLGLWNVRMRVCGLRAVLLRLSGGRALLYVYRPALLRACLKNPGTVAFLRRFGYPAFTSDGDLAAALSHLRRRLAADDGFPHEIGVFLGYPLHDIEGFIRYGGHGCKCRGCWAVYSHEEEARQTFAVYRDCTRSLSERVRAGHTIEEAVCDVASR